MFFRIVLASLVFCSFGWAASPEHIKVLGTLKVKQSTAHHALVSIESEDQENYTAVAYTAIVHGNHGISLPPNCVHGEYLLRKTQPHSTKEEDDTITEKWELINVDCFDKRDLNAVAKTFRTNEPVAAQTSVEVDFEVSQALTSPQYAAELQKAQTLAGRRKLTLRIDRVLKRHTLDSRGVQLEFVLKGFGLGPNGQMATAELGVIRVTEVWGEALPIVTSVTMTQANTY